MTIHVRCRSRRRPLLISLLLAATLQIGDAVNAAGVAPPGTYLVTPIRKGGAGTELPITQGRFFQYALPPGWQVGEDGQFAVTLIGPESRVFTVMVGNAGLPPGYPPERYVTERMAAVQPQGLQLGQPQPVQPRPGFQFAVRYEVRYISVRGNPSRGVAICNVAPAYDTQLMVMNGAFATEDRWADYADWLPLVANQIAATNGAAFGRRGIMAQNLRQSQEFAAAAQAFRDHEQRTWAGVTAQRDEVGARHQAQVQENLGSGNAYVNPYEPGQPMELPRTYQYYWVNRQGIPVGTNDPSLNPNDGSTEEWQPMKLQHP